MLADPAFREEVCRAQNVRSVDAAVDVSGDRMTVRVEQTQPADGIPGFARKFVGEEIRIVTVEEWSDHTAAALDVQIPGKPGRMTGSLRLEPKGSTTVETIDGELTVNIPLVGGKLEKLIAELFTDAMKAEERVGRRWLGGA